MLLQFASRLLLTPQVLERAPGRLRLRYAILARLSASRTSDIQRVADMLAAPMAIHSVNFEAGTGHVTVEFDSTRPESEVLRYFEDMLAFLTAVKGQLKAIEPQRIAEFHPSFVRLVADRLGSSLNLGLAEPELRTAIRNCQLGRDL